MVVHARAIVRVEIRPSVGAGDAGQDAKDDKILFRAGPNCMPWTTRWMISTDRQDEMPAVSPPAMVILSMIRQASAAFVKPSSSASAMAVSDGLVRKTRDTEMYHGQELEYEKGEERTRKETGSRAGTMLALLSSA